MTTKYPNRERLLNLLKHTSNCPLKQEVCQYGISCMHLKQLFSHQLRCERGNCVICRDMSALYDFHYLCCTEEMCNVLNCNLVRSMRSSAAVKERKKFTHLELRAIRQKIDAIKKKDKPLYLKLPPKRPELMEEYYLNESNHDELYNDFQPNQFYHQDPPTDKRMHLPVAEQDDNSSYTEYHATQMNVSLQEEPKLPLTTSQIRRHNSINASVIQPKIYQTDISNNNYNTNTVSSITTSSERNGRSSESVNTSQYSPKPTNDTDVRVGCVEGVTYSTMENSVAEQTETNSLLFTTFSIASEDNMKDDSPDQAAHGVQQTERKELNFKPTNRTSRLVNIFEDDEDVFVHLSEDTQSQKK